MSLENRPGQQSKWVEVDPPELTKDKKIHRGNTARSAQRLVSGLDKLGLRVIEQHKVTEMDLPPSPKFTRYNIVLLQSIAEIPHAILFPLDQKELIRDSTHEWKGNSYYSIKADMDFNAQPFNMFMDVEPKSGEPFKLNLVMPARIPPGKEVSLDLLPFTFRSVGFRYDLFPNPNHRERISEFSERRVDMDMVSGDPRKKSSILGRQTPNGINALSVLHLQTPNPLHLKCYEVELFNPEARHGSNRFLDNTQEIVPESHWQEDERHYCMTGDKQTLTYPLLPIKELGKISTLSMEIHYDGKLDDSSQVHKLLQGFPLSIDGTNQWYATGYLGDGSVSLLFKPEWGENNARLVYNQKSRTRITPKEIHTAVVAMSSLKNALTERLVA